MRLADSVLNITEKFPVSQRYSLVQQIERSAMSVPSNIAEGSARASKKEFVQFLYIARGSLAELETQLILAYARKYVKKEPYIEFCALIDSINKMLGKLSNLKNLRPMTSDS